VLDAESGRPIAGAPVSPPSSVSGWAGSETSYGVLTYAQGSFRIDAPVIEVPTWVRVRIEDYSDDFWDIFADDTPPPWDREVTLRLVPDPPVLLLCEAWTRLHEDVLVVAVNPRSGQRDLLVENNLQPLDRLLRLDELDLAGVGPMGFKFLIARRVGQNVALRVQRGQGEPFDVHIDVPTACAYPLP